MRILLILSFVLAADAFAPTTNTQLSTAITNCIADETNDKATWVGTNCKVATDGTYDATNGQHISDWDVSQVTTMYAMFYQASAFNQDLSAWVVGQVTDMHLMFASASVFNQSLSAWDVGQVTNMYAMFYQASAFNQDLSAWNVGQVTNMLSMFLGASAFNQDLSAWNVSQVTTMQGMFNSASVFNQDLSAWDVGQVTDMQGTFFAASAFNQDLSAWNVSRVTTMFGMFNSASAFNYVLHGQAWIDSTATQTNMFMGAGSNARIAPLAEICTGNQTIGTSRLIDAGTDTATCADCDPGTYAANGVTNCQPWTTGCDANQQDGTDRYVAGTATSDASCAACTTGTWGPADGSADCQTNTDISACTANQTDGTARATAATATADGSCAACTTGTWGPADGSADCQAHTTCGQDVDGSARLSGESDISAGVCDECPPFSSETNNDCTCNLGYKVNGNACSPDACDTVGQATDFQALGCCNC